MKKKYRKGIFFVVYARTKKGVKYLILKRKLHWSGWEFPKGGKRFYETKKMTIKRELKEETGLAPKKIKRFDFSGKFNYDKEYLDRKGLKGQSYLLYAVETKLNENIKLDMREHTDYKWVSFNEALKELTWQNQKKCLRIVNGWLRK